MIYRVNNTRCPHGYFNILLNKCFYEPKGYSTSRTKWTLQKTLHKIPLYTLFCHIVSAETILLWIWPYVLWPLDKSAETIQWWKLFKREIIQGRKLYEEIRYLLKKKFHCSSMQKTTTNTYSGCPNIWDFKVKRLAFGGFLLDDFFVYSALSSLWSWMKRMLLQKWLDPNVPDIYTNHINVWFFN